MASFGGEEAVQETQDVITVNRSRESAVDSFTATFCAPRGAQVLEAKAVLKYSGFWSTLTKSMPSRPYKHSRSKRTRNTLLQEARSRNMRFEWDILYRMFTEL